MAIKYTVMAVCDQWGDLIEPPVRVEKGQMNLIRWQWRDKRRASGVMRGLQPKLRQAKLYCAKCAGG